MTLTFSFPYVNTPAFYTGTSLSSLVPDVFPVGINGRPYVIDQRSNQFTRAFEQRVRDSVDQSTAPGEAAINPGGLWRRGEVSWHLGAGQKYADTAEGQDYRFYKSKGVNPWVKGQLTLLNATKLSLSSTATTSHTVVQDGRVYVSLDGDIKYTTDPFASSPTWTDCTGEPTGKTCTAMATNGDRIYLGFADSGVRYINPAVSLTDASNVLINTSQTYYMLGFAKGFMFGAHDHELHAIDASGNKSLMITPVDTGFSWVGVATGQNAVYAAGYANKKSLIYKITIKADGTLDKGVVALELPTGEVASAISGYLGAIVIGTNKGVRYCTTDSNSNLVAGAIIPTSGEVKKFSSNDRFTYFTWSNYDGVSTGLGRLDLSSFITSNTPAHATDLMYTSTADVLNVVIFNDKPCFYVSGVGLVVEDTANLVASGSIESGIYRWGIPDRKFIARVDTRSTPLVGSISSYMSLDAGTYSLLGIWSENADTENSFNGSDDHAIEAQFKFELNRATATTGPTFTRWAARAYAAPYRSEVFRIPVMLHEQIRVHDQDYFFDVNEELAELRDLINKPRIVTLQIREETVSVIVEDMEWTPVDSVDKDWIWQGTATVTMRSVQE